MTRSLTTLAAAALLGFGLTLSAAAMPMGKLAPAASDNGIIQVKGGHGHGHGHGWGRGGRGHHYGWYRGRHRGHHRHH
jgi:hypothetical protein